MSLLRLIAGLLTRDLTGRTWTREKEHPYFGKLTYFGSKKASECYWEAEVTLPGSPDEPIGVTMTGTEDRPTVEEVRFCQAAIADLDALFDRCYSAFQVEFERWTNTSMPQDWRIAFTLDGFHIPLRGDANEPWEVCYFVSPAGHYFTAVFEQGVVQHVVVDG